MVIVLVGRAQTWMVEVKMLDEPSFRLYGNVVTLESQHGRLPRSQSEWYQEYSPLPFGFEIEDGHMEIGITRVHLRELKFTKMERHLKVTQTFIPLDGRSSVVAVAPPATVSCNDSLPNPKKMQAFLLDGTKGYCMKKGTWHTPPFSLSLNSTFVVLTRKETRKDDMHRKDLAEELSMSFQIELPSRRLDTTS
jgi:ureidoglycolate lyase